MESGVSSPMRGRTANQFAILEEEEGSAGAENGGKESEEGGTVETTAGSSRVGFRDEGQETMEFKAPRTKNKGSKKSRPMTIEEAGRRNMEINKKIAEALKNPPPMDKEMREAMDQLEKKAKEASGKDETESKNTEAEGTQMLGTRATTTPEVSKDGRTEDRRKSHKDGDCGTKRRRSGHELDGEDGEGHVGSFMANRQCSSVPISSSRGTRSAPNERISRDGRGSC
jgi:hypothetical protein